MMNEIKINSHNSMSRMPPYIQIPQIITVSLMLASGSSGSAAIKEISFINQQPATQSEMTFSKSCLLDVDPFNIDYSLMIEKEISFLLDTIFKQQLPPDREMEKIITDNLWELYDHTYLG